MKIEEKITLTCGRDGGLQNMELHGMIMLRISDDKFGRIRLHVENEDKKGVQLQVCGGWRLWLREYSIKTSVFLPSTVFLDWSFSCEPQNAEN